MKLNKILLAILLCLPLSGCNKKVDDLTFQVLSDVHYASNKYFVWDKMYKEANSTNGSGKQMQYLDDIFDIYIDELKANPVKYLLISGDLTYMGALASHQQLALKLQEIEQNGTEVLVIPGNHDITSSSYICPDGDPIVADSISAQQFSEIYGDFGYNQAIEHDEESLSYVYDTKAGVRFFMIDSNIYYGATYGKLRDSTLSWLEAQLKKCKRAHDIPVVVAHHNLLTHNERFIMNYQIGNHNDLEKILTDYDVTLFFSGHIHPQHIVNTDKIADIANEAFCVWPHRYGEVTINSDGWNYESKYTDVQGYAINHNFTNEDLLNYDKFGYDFYYNNSIRQSDDYLSGINTDKETLDAIYDFASSVNVYYFAGRLDLVDYSALDDFHKYANNTFWYSYISEIIEDTSSHTHISYSKDTGFTR